MFRKTILLIFLGTYICSNICYNILILKDHKKSNITNYIYLFSKNNTNEIYIINELKDINLNALIEYYEIDGIIFPGGSSNISNKNTKYWNYVNQSIASGKPIFGICAGFQHIIKYYFPNLLQTECFAYNILLKHSIHNHKWCVPNSYYDLLETEFHTMSTFIYNNKTYIETVINNQIIGTIFHPEKKEILNEREELYLNLFFGRMKNNSEKK